MSYGLARRAPPVVTITQPKAALAPSPLRNARLTSATGVPRVAGAFDGWVWGILGSQDIYRSQDGESNWELYCDTFPSVGSVHKLVKAADGEVIVLNQIGIYKSTGWGPTATWEQKVSRNGGADFQPFGFDGQNGGTKFICAQYGPGTSNWPDSRYCHISLDAGDTWFVAYDSVEEHGAAAANGSHLHGCCYDPWSDRFYLSEGHNGIQGVYFANASDPTNWRLAPGMSFAGVGPGPTTITATDDGLVLGTDDAAVGIRGVLRKADPMDEQQELLYSHRSGLGLGVEGYGFYPVRDESSGVVYVGFRTGVTAGKAILLGATASAAGLIWEAPEAGGGSNLDHIIGVYASPAGRLIARWERHDPSNTAINQLLAGDIPAPGASPNSDPGGVLGGKVTANDSMAAGTGSVTTGLRQTAIGVGARATTAQDSVAIGHKATATGSTGGVVVGSGAHSSGGNAIAIGNLAKTQTAAADGIAIGRSADATGQDGVTIGREGVAGSYAVAVGALAQATHIQGVALGRRAQATASYAIAIGADSVANFTNSVAIGHEVATTSTHQVNIGTKYLEMGLRTPNVVPAGANAVRIALRDNDGALELIAMFPGGATKVLADAS